MTTILQSSKPEIQEAAANGAEVAVVHYASQPSLISALKGVDVVLSTLRDDGLEIQRDVVRAAKAAGVKLFVPSEYGRNTLGITVPCTSFILFPLVSPLLTKVQT